MSDQADVLAANAARDFAATCAVAWRTHLGPSLLGVYLIGSLAHGGFSRRYSDIDVAVITETGLTPADFDAMRAEAAAISGEHAAKLSIFWTDRTFAAGRFRLLLQTPAARETGQWHPTPIAGSTVVDRSISLTATEVAIARRLGQATQDLVDVEVELEVRGFAPTFPWLGMAGAIPLPSKWRIEFCAPIDLSHYGPEAAEDRALVFELSEHVRETIQAKVLENLVARGSAFL